MQRQFGEAVGIFCIGFIRFHGADTPDAFRPAVLANRRIIRRFIKSQNVTAARIGHISISAGRVSGNSRLDDHSDRDRLMIRSNLLLPGEHHMLPVSNRLLVGFFLLRGLSAAGSFQRGVCESSSKSLAKRCRKSVRQSIWVPNHPCSFYTGQPARAAFERFAPPGSFCLDSLTRCTCYRSPTEFHVD